MYKCFNINLGNDEYVENCETINKYLNLKETQEMFCYKSKLKTLNTLNLDNLGTNITCYTFLNNLDFNILNSTVINTKNNIYVDFLKKYLIANQLIFFVFNINVYLIRDFLLFF